MAMPFPYGIVVKVMCRSNFYRTGAFFRIGVCVGDNWYFAINNRQTNIFTDELLQLFIFRMNSYCSITKHGLGAGGCDSYVIFGAAIDRIANIV